MQKELIKPMYIKVEHGKYPLNCFEFKLNINRSDVQCCAGCHNNDCSTWPLRGLDGYTFLVCCTVGATCTKRKYSI